MKVNISGRGIIPGLNTIAPAYNKDLSKNQILRILGSNNLRVFKADDACLITKKNIDEIFRTNTTIKTLAPVKDTVIAPTPDPVVVGVDLAQNNDVVFSTLEATQEILDSVETSTLPLTTEDVITTELTSEGVDVEEVVEAAEGETVELTEETTSHQHNNKKRNKKKNRNNYTAE